MLYFESLDINGIKLSLSFTSVPGMARDPDSRLAMFLKRTGVLANIDTAPLLLEGFTFANVFTSRADLFDRLTMHYVGAAVREFHKIIISADFLGSPLALWNNFGSGFYDFFNEPATGLAISGREFGLGIVRGTRSLLKNSVFGVFNTTAKITGTLAKGLSQLTVDKDYPLMREEMSRQRPRHIGEGFAFGVRDLGLGVFQGITGVLVDPYKVTQREGVGALWKGVLGGGTGLITKPLVGSIDLLTRTAEGIRNTATYWDEMQRTRVRSPRYFGPERVLLPYNVKKSRGQEYLRQAEGGRYKHEWYIFHVKLPSLKILLLSNQRVLYISGDQEEWNIAVDEISSLQMGEQGIVIGLGECISGSLFETPTYKRIILVPERHVYLVYNKLLQVLKRLRHPNLVAEGPPPDEMPR